MVKIIRILFVVVTVMCVVSCTEGDDILNPSDDRDTFLGTWNVNENCQRTDYDVNIVVDPTNSSQVIIQNFGLIGYGEKPPYAIVAGTTITIPTQDMSVNIIVAGSGKLIKGKIEWDYTLNDGADLYTCTATYQKP